MLMELPQPYENVMVTYKNRAGNIVTKEGFYCTLFNHFSIPPGWATFNNMRLPDGFYGSVDLETWEIIKWTAISTTTE